MKKASLVVLALLSAACGLFASNPRKTVSRYLEALAKEKYEAAYPHVSAKDRTARNLEAFASEMRSGANPVLPNPAGVPKIDIQEPALDGERATVRVAITAAGLAAGAPPDTRVFRLVKEEDAWRLFLGWEAQALVAEARRLREEGDLAGAMEKYAKALEADPDSVEASDGRMEIERAALVQEMQQSYLENNVEIINFKVTRGKGRGGAGTSVSGKILNNGHRTLKEVEIGVYFLSGDGKVVAERTYRPVPSTEVTYYGEERSLRRGYVKEFGYLVEGALPASWSGTARAMVTRIEFEDSQ